MSIEVDYKGLLPVRATTQIHWPSGAKATNETEYPRCRTFSAESKLISGTEPITQNEAPEKLFVRPGSLVSVGLETTIDSNTAAAGNQVEGRLLTPLEGPDGRVAVTRGGRLLGRIVRCERRYYPVSRYIVAITFDQIMVDGRWVPLGLESVSANDRAGAQTFFFWKTEHLRLGHGFVSKWRVAQ